MDLEQINTEHLVPRYLAGQLTAADEAAFEAFAAEHPEVYRDVERVLRLKEGLAILQDRKQLAPLVQSRSWRSYLPLAAAAVILLSCGVLLWTRHRQAPPMILAAATADFAQPSSKSSPLVGSYVLLRSRDASTTAPIELPAQRGIVQLRILPATLGDPPYTARLIRLSPQGPQDSVGETTGLLASRTDLYVTVYVDTTTLTSGEYEIVLAPKTASADNNRDHFKLRIP